jgi:2-hydroxychromene-2-carboxylate isomerase
MTAPIDFYFDFSSPYGYFASTRIDELAQKYGRFVAWHPILLGVVFKTTGCMPLSSVPIKGDYAWHDFERTAKHHDIEYHRPAAFPIATTHAARATLWIQNHHGAELATVFAKAAYRAYFADGINIAEPAEIAKIADAVGLDGLALNAGAVSVQIKDQLKAEVDVAMAKGVFGSPFVIVDGEPFWGFDRFEQVEAYLKSRRPTELRAVANLDNKEKKPA